MHRNEEMETSMELTIIAATGGVGRLILDQAIAAGHHVTAVAHHPDARGRDIRTVSIDFNDLDVEALRNAVRGADAVLSGLGPRRASEAGIASRGTAAVVDAMQTVDVRRIIVISAAPVATTPSPGRPNPPKRDPGEGFFTRNLAMPLIKVALRKVYVDLALMEDVLRASELDWTAMRPPRLTNKPGGVYRTAYGENLKRGLTLSRADLADAMLRAVTDTRSHQRTMGVAS
jgi:putative NADH-flavin reductase